MQSIPGPILHRFVLAALCAGVALAAGCAHKEPEVTPTRLRPLFVDGASKPKPAAVKLAAAPAGGDPERPKIEFKFDAPTGKGLRRGVTLRWDGKDGAQMTASAKSGSFNEVTQVGTLLDFSAKLYENGKLTAALSAPEATADTAKRVIIASGGVVLKSLERQTVVNASRIKWSVDSHKVTGTGGVKIESASGTVEGAAFVADTALKMLTVQGSSKGLE